MPSKWYQLCYSVQFDHKHECVDGMFGIYFKLNQIGIRNLTHHKVRVLNLDKEAFLDLKVSGCQDSKTI